MRLIAKLRGLSFILIGGVLLGAGIARASEAAENSGVAAATQIWNIPTSQLSRLPLRLALPRVLPPNKKLDSKYDVDKIGDRNVAKGVDFYSIEREQALGKELSLDLERNVHMLGDPVVNEYVNRIGQTLVRHSDATIPFIIKVVDDDSINAYALPGGYFYVNTGLILAADDEAQLAGVMAHEIAHVAARHATKNQTRAQIFDFATIPLIFFGGPAAMIVRQAMGIAVPMGFLKFSRDAEREADLLGMEYDYASGYDPEEMVKLLEKLKSLEGERQSFVSKAFSTHPMAGERIKRAQKEIEEYLPPRDNYVVDTSEFQSIRSRVASLTAREKMDIGKITPVLRRRGPEQQSTDDSNSDSGRPTLKRKD